MLKEQNNFLDKRLSRRLLLGASAVAAVDLVSGGCSLGRLFVRNKKDENLPVEQPFVREESIEESKSVDSYLLAPEKYVEIANKLLNEGYPSKKLLAMLGFDVGEPIPFQVELTAGKDGLFIRSLPNSFYEYGILGSFSWGEKIDLVSKIEVKDTETGSIEEFGLVYPPNFRDFLRTFFARPDLPNAILMGEERGIIIEPLYIRLSQNEERFVENLKPIHSLEPFLLPDQLEMSYEFWNQRLSLRRRSELFGPNEELFRRFQKGAKEYKGDFYWPTFGKIGQGFYRWHEGIDIPAPHGQGVISAADGQVIMAYKFSWGYGWFLVIKHSESFESLYAHNSALLVEVGQEVKRGDLIARVGSTGYSSGPHLHFEILVNEKPVDPLNYLP